MHLKQIADSAYENANKKGFYDREISMQERIAHQHSEISEAFKAIRDGKYASNNTSHTINLVNSTPEDNVFIELFEKHIKDTFEAEQADLIVRVCETSAAMGYNLDSFVNAVMRYNTLRSYAGKAF